MSGHQKNLLMQAVETRLMFPCRHMSFLTTWSFSCMNCPNDHIITAISSAYWWKTHKWWEDRAWHFNLREVALGKNSQRNQLIALTNADLNFRFGIGRERL